MLQRWKVANKITVLPTTTSTPTGIILCMNQIILRLYLIDAYICYEPGQAFDYQKKEAYDEKRLRGS